MLCSRMLTLLGTQRCLTRSASPAEIPACTKQVDGDVSRLVEHEYWSSACSENKRQPNFEALSDMGQTNMFVVSVGDKVKLAQYSKVCFKSHFLTSIVASLSAPRLSNIIGGSQQHPTKLFCQAKQLCAQCQAGRQDYPCR